MTASPDRSPSYELDRKVAEVVMGWEPGLSHVNQEGYTAYTNGFVVARNEWFSGSRRIDFAPSRNIADAWAVVEHMRAMKWDVTVICYADAGWRAIASASTQRLAGSESAKSAAHAICLCALNVMEREALRAAGRVGP